MLKLCQFHAAIQKLIINRCDKLISMCDIHGEYFFSETENKTENRCCGVYFDPKPFFVNTGTCFTSHLDVWEKWPFAFSFIKFWINVQSQISPGDKIFDIKYI